MQLSAYCSWLKSFWGAQSSFPGNNLASPSKVNLLAICTSFWLDSRLYLATLCLLQLVEVLLRCSILSLGEPSCKPEVLDTVFWLCTSFWPSRGSYLATLAYCSWLKFFWGAQSSPPLVNHLASFSKVLDTVFWLCTSFWPSTVEDLILQLFAYCSWLKFFLMSSIPASSKPWILANPSRVLGTNFGYVVPS